jgi:hypothetical protein
MSSILYYSNFCEHSKKLLQILSKSQVSKDVHFICIDKRVRGEDNKMYIVFENGKRIIMPENITKVPALLLMTQNYKVIYGEAIYDYFKPKQETLTKQVTHNNLEPMAFSFGGGGGSSGSSYGGIVSDNYSFLDMDADSLTAKGDGGLRQMHSYVTLDYMDQINTPTDEADFKSSKMPEGSTIENLQRQREQEISNIQGNGGGRRV